MNFNRKTAITIVCVILSYIVYKFSAEFQFSPIAILGGLLLSLMTLFQILMYDRLLRYTVYITNTLITCVSVYNSMYYTDLFSLYHGLQDLSSNVDRTFKAFLEGITFGIYDGYSDEKKAIENIKDLLSSHEIHLDRLFYFLIPWILIGSLLHYFIFHNFRIFLTTCCFVAMNLLILGISLPMMFFVANVNVMDGFYKFEGASEIKSILSTIVSLWYSNKLVCIFVFLTSILLPLTKIIISFLIINQSKHKNTLESILKNIGKWSFADIFVISIYIAYMGMANKSGSTDVELLWGFYAFFYYCILSMVTSILLNKIIAKDPATVNLVYNKNNFHALKKLYAR